MIKYTSEKKLIITYYIIFQICIILNYFKIQS